MFYRIRIIFKVRMCFVKLFIRDVIVILIIFNFGNFGEGLV